MYEYTRQTKNEREIGKRERKREGMRFNARESKRERMFRERGRQREIQREK